MEQIIQPRVGTLAVAGRRARVPRRPVGNGPVLGARDPAAWIDHHLLVSELGKPFALADYQRRVLAAMFQFDETGKLWIDEAVWSEPKKGGKTTLAAALALWFADTQEAPNEILVVANDLEQATSRAFATMLELLKRNAKDRDGRPGIGTRAKRQTATLITFATGTVIKAIASEFAGAAGSNHGLTLWDEIWAGRTEPYRRLWDELVPVPTRTNSIRLAFSYAGFEGESRTLRDAYLAGVDTAEHPEGRGERIDAELPIYRSREGAGRHRVTFWSHECRQPWQTETWLAKEKAEHTATGRVSTYLRLFENRWVSGESVFITADLWDACVDPTLTPMAVGAGSVYVGVDIGIKNDSTGIVALQMAPHEGRTLWRLLYHSIMRPTPGVPVDHRDIAARLRYLHRTLHPRRIGIDPSQALEMIAYLKREGLPITEVSQTAEAVDEMGVTLITAIQSRALVLYPDAQLRQQALNTVAVEKPDGMMRMDKAKSGRKIDAIVALAIALRMSAPVRPEGMLAEYATAEAVTGLVPVAERTRRPRWYQRLPTPLRVGDAIRDRNGTVTGYIVRLVAKGITIRAVDGTERTFTRGTVEGFYQRVVERAQIDADAARHAGWEKDPDNGDWLRGDGTVMRALQIPDTWGEIGWYKFDPDDDEPLGLDHMVELEPLTFESAPTLPCPFYPDRCPAQTHLAERAGDGWVVKCPNNLDGVRGWDDETLSRGAVRPEARPDTSLYPPGQTAPPGARTTGWTS